VEDEGGYGNRHVSRKRVRLGGGPPELEFELEFEEDVELGGAVSIAIRIPYRSSLFIDC